MILEEFTEWQSTKSEFEGFKIFADEYMGNCRTGITGVLHELMYQIYNTQCCIEGLLEDMEIMNKEITSLKKCKKGKKKCV